MKKIMMMMLLISAAANLKAQDIQITRFEQNHTSLIARANPIYDNAGEACAVIRFFVRNPDYIIEPNLGNDETGNPTRRDSDVCPQGNQAIEC